MSVLFLCVASSARSQLAEGLARARFPQLAFLSAGSKPTQVNPRAIEALREVGIDASAHASKLVDDIAADGVELVVTLCAEEVCPAFLRAARRLHWPMPDPAGGDLAAFRRGRERIAARLDGLEAALALPPRTSITSLDDLDEVRSLLAACKLPADGLADARMAVARIDGEVVGCAGVEVWGADGGEPRGSHGLLRSVAVAPDRRGQRIGEALVADRLAWARAEGLADVSLLTTSASLFFGRLGFTPIERSALPPDLVRSTQLGLGVCSTATAMTISCVHPAPPPSERA
jgi:arsenate reductase